MEQPRRWKDSSDKESLFHGATQKVERLLRQGVLVPWSNPEGYRIIFRDDRFQDEESVAAWKRAETKVRVQREIFAAIDQDEAMRAGRACDDSSESSDSSEGTPPLPKRSRVVKKKTRLWRVGQTPTVMTRTRTMTKVTLLIVCMSFSQP